MVIEFDHHQQLFQVIRFISGLIKILAQRLQALAHILTITLVHMSQ
jgi:hypothetical protein